MKKTIAKSLIQTTYHFEGLLMNLTNIQVLCDNKEIEGQALATIKKIEALEAELIALNNLTYLKLQNNGTEQN
jgi:hypothetical protein